MKLDRPIAVIACEAVIQVLCANFQGGEWIISGEATRIAGPGLLAISGQVGSPRFRMMDFIIWFKEVTRGEEMGYSPHFISIQTGTKEGELCWTFNGEKGLPTVKRVSPETLRLEGLHNDKPPT